MSRLYPPIVAAQAATESESLLPPAIKAVTIGFVGGVIALMALTVLAPSLMHFEEMEGVSKRANASRAKSALNSEKVSLIGKDGRQQSRQPQR